MKVCLECAKSHVMNRIAYQEGDEKQRADIVFMDRAGNQTGDEAWDITDETLCRKCGDDGELIDIKGPAIPNVESQVRKGLGRYFCDNTRCAKWTQEGCLLRKVGLTCDNGECKFNVSPIPGVYQCGCMDVHLDADGKCLGFKEKGG